MLRSPKSRHVAGMNASREIPYWAKSRKRTLFEQVVRGETSTCSKKGGEQPVERDKIPRYEFFYGTSMAPFPSSKVRALPRSGLRAATALAGWFMALHFTLSLVASFDRALGQGESAPSVVLIDIKGAIGFVAAGQLAKAAEKGAALGSPAVIVQIDTPGGLLSSTREMIHAILASPVPIVMYVAPDGSRAASAGTYLMYASHVAAMAPGTHLGAATPISLSPSGIPGSPPKAPPSSEKQPDPDPTTAAARKSVNDAVAYIRTLAELRGRNADWGEKAVRESATLTAPAALKERVADVIAKNVEDLLSQIDGRSVNTAAGEVRTRNQGAQRCRAQTGLEDAANVGDHRPQHRIDPLDDRRLWHSLRVLEPRCGRTRRDWRHLPDRRSHSLVGPPR